MTRQVVRLINETTGACWPGAKPVVAPDRNLNFCSTIPPTLVAARPVAPRPVGERHRLRLASKVLGFRYLLRGASQLL